MTNPMLRTLWVVALMIAALSASIALANPPPATAAAPVGANPPPAAAAPPVAASPFTQLYQDSHCERELVVCYDREGELLSASGLVERLPTSVRPGDRVTVVVLTDRVKTDAIDVSVAFFARKSLEHLFAAPLDVGAFAAPDKPGPLSFVSDAVPEDAASFVISFQRKPAADGRGAETTTLIAVDLGYSYYSVALLVAATFKADRRVLPDLSTVSDHAVGPGLALNVFPGGRQRGVIGYARRCLTSTVSRCLANNLGFQLATDLDLTAPTDKLYAGLVFEPVAGLAVVGGVSLRKVNVVPSAGELPALEATDGSAPTNTRRILRGYVGITITLDLLNTISATSADLKKVKVP